MSGVETGTITTDIPARLDRLPWARWHWLVVIGLGTVWILDGLEVTIVGSMSEALKPDGTGLGMSSSDIGLAGAIYVAGACVGALFFGQLTDRFGRKKLFLITLGVYTVATVLTAFSMNPMWYFACRFLTGTGIGGEYAAINSAIDELIPAKYRGRIDIAINGSFWVGAAGGSLLTIPLLDPKSSTRPSAGGSRSGWARSSRSASCSCGATCRRARAGCSSTAGRTRARRSSATSRARRGGDRARPPDRLDETLTIRQRKTIRAAADRQDRLHALPEAHHAVLLALRRPGVPLQRVLLHLRRHAHDVPGRQADRLLHRGVRGQQLPGARSC